MGEERETSPGGFLVVRMVGSAGGDEPTKRRDEMADATNNVDELLLETATIGWPTIDKVKYRVSLHGCYAEDFPMPHIHLDRADDLERVSFEFVISLVDMLATGEPVLVFQKDLANHVYLSGRTECRWDGYPKLHDGVVEYLEAGPEAVAPKHSRSNLESSIIAWNNESGDRVERLSEYIKNGGIKVLDRYKVYFPTLCAARQSDCQDGAEGWDTWDERDSWDGGDDRERGPK